MVKLVCALFVLVAFAAPAFAQDYPQMEIALGYGNINVKDIEGRHSGFVSHQAFNVTSVIAIENYFGYYAMGSDPSFGKMRLLTDIFGAKFNYRTAGPVIYGVAGLGGGFLQFPDFGAGTNNSLAFRVGGGVDIPWGDSLAFKVDVSRTSFHFDGWKSGMNISTGIVLKISQ
jgi:hypothetical protein